MSVNDTDTTKLRDAAEEFLAQPRIAVAGVSRDPKQPANLIYRRLRDAGHEVFAVNPNAEEVEGLAAPRDRALVDLREGDRGLPRARDRRHPGRSAMLHVLQVTGKVPRRVPVPARPKPDRTSAGG